MRMLLRHPIIHNHMNKNVTALILIIIAVGIYFTVTKSVLDSARTIKAVNDQYSSAIKKADELIKVRDQVLKEYNSITQENRDRLDKMIPSTVDNIRLIIDMNALAVRDGIVLRGLGSGVSSASKSGVNDSIPSAGGVPTVDTVKVTFSVTAPYMQFISFLKDVEANLRIMNVDHLSVTGSDTGVYDFSVSITTYWLRQ